MFNFSKPCFKFPQLPIFNLIRDGDQTFIMPNFFLISHTKYLKYFLYY